MVRKFSFWFFLAAVVLIGIFFFRIVQPLIFPLMLAAVLTLLFRPLYDQLTRLLRGHARIAAALSAAVVLFVVVLPIVIGGAFAAQELVGLAKAWTARGAAYEPTEMDQRVQVVAQELSREELQLLNRQLQSGSRLSESLPLGPDESAYQHLVDLEQRYTHQQLVEAFGRLAKGSYLDPENLPWLGPIVTGLQPYFSPEEMVQFRESSLALFETMATQLYAKTSEIVTNVIQFVIGFAVMALALYYFFADGPTILRNIENLLPLENPDEEAVWKQFESVCRGVVLGTILAAFVQAALLGVGLAVVGIERVWLLIGVTVLCALIPFIGAAGVYVPVTIYLLWSGHYWGALGLLLYGMLIVSTADNLVRAYVIHGSSRMHPLAALVSVLGALSLVGLWGVFIGPIVAGIFYSMLHILHRKLRRIEQEAQAEASKESTHKDKGSPPLPLASSHTPGHAVNPT